MTRIEEMEMHELAAQLEKLTDHGPWEAMRYMAIARIMERLAEYCAVCDCHSKKRAS